MRHSVVSEYVRDQAHTNGIESFWAMIKRSYDGTFHKISPKHLQRYVSEFAGKHNIRELGTLAQVQQFQDRSEPSRHVGREKHRPVELSAHRREGHAVHIAEQELLLRRRHSAAFKTGAAPKTVS